MTRGSEKGEESGRNGEVYRFRYVGEETEFVTRETMADGDEEVMYGGDIMDDHHAQKGEFPVMNQLASQNQFHLHTNTSSNFHSPLPHFCFLIQTQNAKKIKIPKIKIVINIPNQQQKLTIYHWEGEIVPNSRGSSIFL